MIAAAPSRQAERVPMAIPVAIGAAWLVSVLAQTSGRAALLNHGALIEGTPFHAPPPLWVALPLFLVAWQAMVVAMMLPSTLPMLRLFRATVRSAPRPRVMLAVFVGGYVAVWGAFGAVAFAFDIGVHRTVERSPWLAGHPWVIGGLALALAGAFQFSDLKERCLTECRHPGAYLLQHYRRGVGEALRLGWGHGLFCLGCCWALMLLMFAAGVAQLWWMAALTAVMVYEKLGRSGARLTPFIGAALLLLAALVLLHPAWVPPLIGHS